MRQLLLGLLSILYGVIELRNVLVWSIFVCIGDCVLKLRHGDLSGITGSELVRKLSTGIFLRDDGVVYGIRLLGR